MKKELAVRFEFDTTLIRQVYAMITGEVLMDEEIDKRFVNIDPIVINGGTEFGVLEGMQMCAAFVLTIITKEKEKEEKSDKSELPKSRFQEKLDKAIEESKKEKEE
jgi:hypothetical protein